ncbi:Uncharacterised protein [Mycobacteroides abscessus subsp. abscessus]|nr:Uncharacterised protein [Mycobacteroides abscessus subsp. abscessus]
MVWISHSKLPSPPSVEMPAYPTTSPPGVSRAAKYRLYGALSSARNAVAGHGESPTNISRSSIAHRGMSE